MKRSSLKLAAYLDEAGEDPERGCETLNINKISHIALRHVWTGNICDISNTGHQKLTKIISNHNLEVMLIASELGKIDASQLTKVNDDQINNIINICKYYHAPMVRIFIGNKNKNVAVGEIEEWMNRVGEICANNSIIPLFEITSDAQIYRAVDIVQLLLHQKQWKLLYDPVSLIIKQNVNPFIKYWTLLKNYTAAIDIRDIKIGKGFKPAGFGDSKIDLTIQDALQNDYSGWFIMEPSLRQKSGQSTTKRDTFTYALESLDYILDSV